MAKLPFPTIRGHVPILAAFVLALALLLTRTWQFAILAGFVAGMLSARATRGFLAGGLGVAAAWGAYLTYLYLISPAQAVASLIAEILGVGAGLGPVLPALTILLGFLVGGVGGLVGQTSSRLFLWIRPEEATVPPKA